MVLFYIIKRPKDFSLRYTRAISWWIIQQVQQLTGLFFSAATNTQRLQFLYHKLQHTHTAQRAVSLAVINATAEVSDS